MLAVGITALSAGVAAADQGQPAGIDVDPAPSATAPAAPQQVEDPDITMHQCNAILGALTGGLIGGTLSALPGAAIGAGLGALIGWSLLYPPGPPLACWQPPPA
ncbi:hypothetical protein VMT65_06485 [Nocardia sp. CDC153]|uniref:hypothetical protein n=1 Tax=Nocardia sp. CDC153 TaxID=3112167 RepID=UPI002DBD8A7B|nr:hypothetical protein [Nocardia sp. CDC153]MEC3952672.1 hypothetical protein [Nocardia sp. CDC153]